MKLPLEGIRVLDLSHMLPGPFSTMLLADMGAEVIKVEAPGGGDGFRLREPKVNKEGSAFLLVNRGKKSCVLDLRTAEGLERFMALAASADVLLEQYRPGTADRLGIGYEAVKKVNPGIIYCSLSGYGQTGPYRDMPGHDINYLSISGVLDTIGRKNEAPALAGVQIADMCGAQWAAISVLLALLAKKNSGEGQYIDLSMTDAVLPWLSLFVSDYAANGTVSSRGETRSSGMYAYYNLYETGDGRYVSLGAAEPKFWAAFCRAVGHEEWTERQMAVGEEGEDLIGEVAAMFRTRSQKEWTDLLFDRNCCFTPVNNIEEALSDPQLLHRGMRISLSHPVEGELLNFAFPVKFSGMKAAEPAPPPAYGEHTAQFTGKNN